MTSHSLPVVAYCDMQFKNIGKFDFNSTNTPFDQAEVSVKIRQNRSSACAVRFKLTIDIQGGWEGNIPLDQLKKVLTTELQEYYPNAGFWLYKVPAIGRVLVDNPDPAGSQSIDCRIYDTQGETVLASHALTLRKTRGSGTEVWVDADRKQYGGDGANDFLYYELPGGALGDPLFNPDGTLVSPLPAQDTNLFSYTYQLGFGNDSLADGKSRFDLWGVQVVMIDV